MRPGGRQLGVGLLVLALLLMPSMPALGGFGELSVEPPGEEEPDRSLAEPLAKLATSHAEIEAIGTHHAAGQAWARAQLQAEEDLAGATEKLYEHLGLAAPAETEAPPSAFRAPLAPLVTLQAHHAAGTGPDADRADTPAQAYTLGALEPVLAALEQARHEAPEDPVFVDPLGLIVVGGSGDDTYEAQTVGPTGWKGPLLVVEPAGNDTYKEPIAAPFTVDRSQLPGPGDILRFQLASIALELGGDDTYENRTASADLGGPTSQAILLDRGGNDTYATTEIARTTAHASPGFAYLRDEKGDDAYHARREGIAHSERSGRAVLWDERGNDIFSASDGSAEFTHAAADSRQASALLWDERGNDSYEAGLDAYGSAWNDAFARFVDEEGEDEYSLDNPLLSFGCRYQEGAPFIGDSITNRGLGEFVEGNGTDTYDWPPLDEDDPTCPLPENDDVQVVHDPNRKWGVFIDCETPADADRPCPEKQHDARCTVMRHPAEDPSAIEPAAAIVLDPVEEGCRGNGP